MTLDAQASEVLEAIASGLAARPKRVYVANGVPAFDDCEQLTIHPSEVVRGTTSVEQPVHPAAPTTVTMIVTRTWCIPTVDEDGSPPAESALHASGMEVTAGVQELWQAAVIAIRSVSCKPSIIGARPIEPSGGYVGWTVILSWTL